MTAANLKAEQAFASVEETRELARIVELDDVVVHSNADSLELAIVGGWQCCVRKGEFKKGDKALYCEIDSLLPTARPEFAFLEARTESLKLIGESVYSRIKTIKLRKELSQGIVIPLSPELAGMPSGTNVTALLGVLKYESVQKTETYAAKKTWLDRLAHIIAGPGVTDILEPWPSFLRKSEQDRVQNRNTAYKLAVESGERFEVTYKLDGASMTAYFVVEESGNPKIGVCSRNNEVSTEDIIWGPVEQVRRWVASFLLENRRAHRIKRLIVPKWRKGVFASDNEFVRALMDNNLPEKMRILYEMYGVQIALQGELVGPGIQSNFECLPERKFFVYSVYILKDYSGKYGLGLALPDQARELMELMKIPYVPVFDEDALLPATIKECLALADGPAAFKSKGYREGLVFKSKSRDFSFKAISNSYLLKADS